MNDQHQINRDRLARDIFLRAVELESIEARVVYLDGACQGDAALRSRVEALLESHRQDSFLETPAIEGPPAGISETAVSEGPGTVIGRYKLLQKIGEGGFGVVYMAEQKEPVKRRVAVKIIKLGMDTRQVVARFEAERQALAMMDHQNIARVLDAGATDTGRPYFVMELVRGVPITDYCDQNRLTTGERLDLFMAVCLAVQHAHQKGIIHRDIKPSNILVTLHDGVPVPKVIDFGIAKATQQELTEKTVFTQFRQMIGTPAYMSPEQAEMSGLDIDTRADIYSLGVLLYELLTGRTPLDAKALLAGGYDEIRRRIKEEEPPKPSTRAGTLQGEERTTVARHRKVEPSRLGSELRGDLDWIVMRALEKDRTRRYDTAKGLANDLRRYLNHEPVEAAAPGVWYRSRKFIVRHRAAVATVGLVCFALVSGTIVSTWQAIRATRASQRERAAREEALEALDAATTAEERADREAEAARRNLYASDMLLARQAVDASNFRRARELLERHQPSNAYDRGVDLRGWEWHWLRNQLRSGRGEPLTTLPGPVFGLDLSSDGRYLAASTVAGMLKVFEVRSGREIATVAEGNGLPKKAVFLEGEHRLVFNYADRESYLTNGFLKFWDAGSGRVDHVFRYDRGVGAKCVSPDGSMVLFNAVDGQLHMLDIPSGSVLWRNALVQLGTLHTADSFLFSRPTGEEYLIGERNGEIRIYSAADGEPTRHIRAHDEPITALNMSPDGRLVASASGFSGTTIKLWDSRTLELLDELKGHQGWVSDFEFTSDARRLVSSSADQTVRLWDLETHEQLAVYRGQSDEVWEVELTPDDRFVVAGSKDGSIHTWEADVQRLADSPVIAQGVRRCAMSGTGHHMALLGTDGSVKLGQVGQDIHFEEFNDSGTNNTFICFSGNGRHLIAGKEDGSISLYDVESGNQLHSLPVFQTAVAEARALDSTQTLLAVDSDYNLALVRLDAEPGGVVWRTVIKELKSQRYFQIFAVSPDGRFAVLKDFFGTIRLLDLANGEELRSAQNSSIQPIILGSAFSPDGRTLATADASGVVGLWDVATLERYATLDGHRNSSRAVVFVPDSDRLISAGGDEDAVIVWDLVSHQELLRLSAEGTMSQLEFCPQWNLLIALNLNGDVYAWRAPP